MWTSGVRDFLCSGVYGSGVSNLLGLDPVISITIKKHTLYMYM